MIVKKRAMKRVTKWREQTNRGLMRKEIEGTTDRSVQKDVVNALVGLVIRVVHHFGTLGRMLIITSVYPRQAEGAYK